MSGETRLQIGEVAALTGISAGRIRHYESRGLIAPGHLDSGYRTFSVEDLLRLLQIDLLRNLGMGLEQIASTLEDQPAGLRPALQWHREALENQKLRLEVLIEAVDEALSGPEEGVAAMVARLAEAHRESSLGIFGTLERPLSAAAAQALNSLLGEWQLPVSELFAQMRLPAPITDFLERLAATPGQQALFERLHRLAERVLETVLAGDEAAAETVAANWVEQEMDSPPPADVLEILQDAAPRLLKLPVVRYGFIVWAESMSPLAARILRCIQSEAEARGAAVIGAIVVPPPARPSPRSRQRRSNVLQRGS